MAQLLKSHHAESHGGGVGIMRGDVEIQQLGDPKIEKLGIQSGTVERHTIQAICIGRTAGQRPTPISGRPTQPARLWCTTTRGVTTAAWNILSRANASRPSNSSFSKV